ncbi:MAG: transposase [Thermotogae bacterium]|nr:transposase [Thermotogota bacterium]
MSKELKRRSRVIGAFPNERSLIRLAVAIPIDMNEERLMGRRYLDMEESSL